MPNNWKKYKLEELVNYINGGSWPANLYKENGIPVVRVSDVNKGRVDLSECKYLDANYYDKYSKHKLIENDLIICTVGSHPDQQSSVVGGVGIVSKEVEGSFLNQNAVLLRSLNTNLLCQKWVGYFAKSPILKNHVESEARGSANQVRIAISNLINLEINLPPLPEQQAIAEILSSLDDKIELNLQTNKTLEEMANALYKHWFVDFGPFQHGKFVVSELGLIPEGWEVKNLSSIVDVRDGTHDSPKRTDFGKYLITSKHIKDNEIDFNGAYFISEFDFEQINKRSKVTTGDIFITMIGTVGNIYLVKEELINFAIKNVGLIRTSEVPELQEFLYLFFKSPIGKEFIETRKTGSTQQYISLSELRNFPLIIPNKVIINDFSVLVKDFFNQIQNNIKENTNLKQTRDYLLPKLISGEIRVKEALELVKSVL